jgi:uncharacterized integral membrane protein
MGLLRWIAGFCITLCLVVFAVANRQMTDVYWSPLHGPLHLPLYLTVLVFMAAGFLIGLLMMGFNALPLWWTSKQQKKQIKKLERDLKDAAQTMPPHSVEPHRLALPFLKRKN